jgi:hypothetical protein
LEYVFKDLIFPQGMEIAIDLQSPGLKYFGTEAVDLERDL